MKDASEFERCRGRMKRSLRMMLRRLRGRRGWSRVEIVAIPFHADAGEAAKRQAITNSRNTIYSIKRFMGRKFDEVQEEIKRVP